MGLELPGRMLTGYVYFQEFMPSNYQNLMGTIEGCSEAAVYIWLTIYYRFGNYGWKWPVALAALINFVGLVLTVIFIPESPKWLMEKGRYIESYKVFKRMAEVNGKPSTEIIEKLLGTYRPADQAPNQNTTLESDMYDFRTTDQERTLSIGTNNEGKGFDVWKELKSNRVMLVNLVVMTMVWLSGSFNYYLISYQLKYLPGDLYINGVVSSLSEILANVTSGFSLYAFGIRNALVISFILAACGMLCLIFV